MKHERGVPLSLFRLPLSHFSCRKQLHVPGPCTKVKESELQESIQAPARSFLSSFNSIPYTMSSGNSDPNEVSLQELQELGEKLKPWRLELKGDGNTELKKQIDVVEGDAVIKKAIAKHDDAVELAVSTSYSLDLTKLIMRM